MDMEKHESLKRYIRATRDSLLRIYRDVTAVWPLCEWAIRYYGHEHCYECPAGPDSGICRGAEDPSPMEMVPEILIGAVMDLQELLHDLQAGEARPPEE